MINHGKYIRLIHVARAYAANSKDTSTKVGALIVETGSTASLASAWNGAPMGSRADEDERFERPEKYSWTCHAEMNAIAFAARAGVSVRGATLVVTHAPCMICARLIVQAGISQVYYPEPTGEFALRWKDDLKRSQALFKECGVSTYEFTPEEEQCA